MTVPGKIDGITMEEYFKGGYALVVEDHPPSRKIMKKRLESFGIEEVVLAEDGYVALSILKDDPPPFLGKGAKKKERGNCLFVLLDWRMPRIEGIEVAREIRADKAIENTPILMVTVEDHEDRIVEAIADVGVNGYLIKPFKTMDLKNKMLGIIHQRANPPDHVKLIKASEKLVDEGKYDDAIFILERALEICPNNARIYVHLGDVYIEKGDYQEAEQAYSQATKLNPKYLKTYLAQAELFGITGEKEKAIFPLKKIVEISPRNPARLVELGKLCLEVGDTKEAQIAFKKAVELDPGEAEEIAKAYFEAGMADEAESFLGLL